MLHKKPLPHETCMTVMASGSPKIRKNSLRRTAGRKANNPNIPKYARSSSNKSQRNADESNARGITTTRLATNSGGRGWGQRRVPGGKRSKCHFHKPQREYCFAQAPKGERAKYNEALGRDGPRFPPPLRVRGFEP